MKLEHRLTLVTAFVTAISLAGSLFTAFWFVKRSAAQELDELVVDGANAIAIVVADHEGRLEPTESFDIDVPEYAVHTVHHVAVFESDGRRVAKSPRFDGVPETLQQLSVNGQSPKFGRTFDLQTAAGLMRAVVHAPSRRPELRVLHAVPREPMDAKIAHQRQVFSLLFVSSLALVILGAKWLGRRLASDVNQITDVARRVRSGELSARAGTSRLASPETRNLATELNRMIAELLTLLASQRSFISYAAHELRSPLTALQGELQLALRRDRTADSYVETLGTALSEVQALAQLAEDLLTLARAQAHPHTRESTQLDDVIEEAVRLVQGATQVKEVEIRTDVDALRSVQVIGSRQDLARALRNLLENAIKFGPPGGTVDLGGSRRDQTVTLTVEDQGPGVAERDMEGLFQPFFRGSSRASASSEGTGLGLAIAREIARNVGGDVELVPGKRAGACFRLRFVIDTLSKIE